MPYEIRYSEEAVRQVTQLRAFEQVAILDQIEQVLGVNPALESKARVFYDVEGEAVQVVQVLSKEHAIRYLGESS